MATSSQSPAEGMSVAGKYRLVRLLGRGGMGSVWEGVHTSLGTQVAVKFIEAEFAGQADVRDRFFNEAFAAARLQSKHVVQVHDHGVDANGRPYIVMEYLSGEPLDARLIREGTLSLSDVAALLSQVARAVKKAHAAGIVHRDLKPENIFLVWDDEDHRDLVKLVDFGIAKFTQDTGLSSATRTGAVIGTPHFMSPEQARGLKGIDPRADIWSIGVIAYRAVTGVLPFDGEGVGDLLVKICTIDPVPPSQHVPVPESFDEWMRRSLAKSPKDRFQSVDEQASCLAEVVASGGELGRAGLQLQSLQSMDTVHGLERGSRSLSARSKSWWFVLAGVGALAVAAVGLAVSRAGHDVDEAHSDLPTEVVPALGAEPHSGAAPSSSEAEIAVAAPEVRALTDEASADGAGGAPPSQSGPVAATTASTPAAEAPRPPSAVPPRRPSRPPVRVIGPSKPPKPKDELGY